MSFKLKDIGTTLAIRSKIAGIAESFVLSIASTSALTTRSIIKVILGISASIVGMLGKHGESHVVARSEDTASRLNFSFYVLVIDIQASRLFNSGERQA